LKQKIILYLKEGDVVNLSGAVVPIDDVDLEDGNGFFVRIDHGQFLLANSLTSFPSRRMAAIFAEDLFIARVGW